MGGGRAAYARGNLVGGILRKRRRKEENKGEPIKDSQQSSASINPPKREKRSKMKAG